MKLYDRLAKEQSELNDVSKRLHEATTRQLELQQAGKRSDLSEIADIAKEKRQLEQSLKQARSAAEQIKSTDAETDAETDAQTVVQSADPPTGPTTRSGRSVRTPSRFQSA